MKNMFQEFEQLAHEWADFDKTYGSEIGYNGYEDFVHCKRDANSIVYTVTFGVYGREISVMLLSDVYFSQITHETVARWESMVANGREILKAEKQRRKRLAELGDV